MITAGDPVKNIEDSHLEFGKREKYDFKVFDQDIWDFLSSRYGGTPIKRFYRHTKYGNTQCDVNFTTLKVQIGFADQLT